MEKIDKYKIDKYYEEWLKDFANGEPLECQRGHSFEASGFVTEYINGTKQVVLICDMCKHEWEVACADRTH